MVRRDRGAVLAVLLLVLPPAALAADPEPPAAAAPAATARIDGFRSAQWGMTEPQVKAAIHKDFNIPADKTKSEDNLAERTHVLSVVVPELLEGAGAARVSYIFGYTGKKLIQVNVLWGSAVDQQVATDKILAVYSDWVEESVGARQVRPPDRAGFK